MYKKNCKKMPKKLRKGQKMTKNCEKEMPKIVKNERKIEKKLRETW